MEQLFSFQISTFSKRDFHKIPFQKPYETKPFLDLALTSFSWRPVQEPAGRPRLCSRAGQARLPLQRAVSYRGSFFPYLADFRCRARARAARPAWPGWAGQAWLHKGRFPTWDCFPVLSRFSISCPRGQARPAWLGWAGQPSQAWLPLQRVVSYRGSFSRTWQIFDAPPPRARGLARPAFPSFLRDMVSLSFANIQYPSRSQLPASLPSAYRLRFAPLGLHHPLGLQHWVDTIHSPLGSHHLYHLVQLDLHRNYMAYIVNTVWVTGLLAYIALHGLHC